MAAAASSIRRPWRVNRGGLTALLCGSIAAAVAASLLVRWAGTQLHQMDVQNARAAATAAASHVTGSVLTLDPGDPASRARLAAAARSESAAIGSWTNSRRLRGSFLESADRPLREDMEGLGRALDRLAEGAENEGRLSQIGWQAYDAGAKAVSISDREERSALAPLERFWVHAYSQVIEQVDQRIEADLALDEHLLLDPGTSTRDRAERASFSQRLTDDLKIGGEVLGELRVPPALEQPSDAYEGARRHLTTMLAIVNGNSLTNTSPASEGVQRELAAYRAERDRALAGLQRAAAGVAS